MINTCYQREELEPADLELMWIEIDYHTFSYLLYCIYRPPSSDSTNWTKFSCSLDKVSEYSDKIIIVCDLTNKLSVKNFQLQSVSLHATEHCLTQY